MKLVRTDDTRLHNLAVALLFLLSGSLALVHEVVWIRKLTLVFGATAPALSIVLAVFFGGMALGAWLLAQLWRSGPPPLQLYAGLEAGIGLWAFLFPSFLSASEHLYALLYNASSGRPGWLFLSRTAFSSILLLPPSALMGATLPVLVRHFVSSSLHLGARVARLYALNTFGGALGAFATGFWLIRTLGVDGTIYAAGAANLFTGVTAWALARPTTPPLKPPTSRRSHAPAKWNRHARIAATVGFAVSGFTGLAYEVVWTRYLSLFMMMSTYSYSTILTVFLLGLALGSLAAARWADRHLDLLALFGYLQISIGLVSLAFFPGLTAVAWSPVWSRLPDPLLIQFALCVVLMIPSTTLMGTAFPLVSKIMAVDAEAPSAVVGALYALNTVGAIFGSVLAGFVLIPVLGTQASVAVLAGINIAIGVGALAYEPAWHWKRLPLVLGGTLGVALLVHYTLPSDLPRVRLQQYVADAERVLEVREGLMNTVWVSEDAWGRRALWGNTSVLGRSRRLYRMDLSAQRFQGHIPLLLHLGNSQAVLGIGFGTGQTFGAQLLHPIHRLDVVEISPEVVDLGLSYFGHHPDGFRPDPRARIIIDDGRAFVALTPERYDIISLEMPPQMEAGVVHFYTREFYMLALARLRPNGVLAQWVPIYNVTPEETRGITRTFLSVFPQSALWYNGANLLLLGFNGTFELRGETVRARLSRPEIASDLAVSHLGDPDALLSDPKCFLAGFLIGPAGLADFAQGAPLYTDNFPSLEFTWRSFNEWGPERQDRLILENHRIIQSHLEDISPYLRDTPGRAVLEIGEIRDRYLRRLEAIATDNLATRAMWRGLASDSLALYRRALTLSPDFAQAHVNLGSLLQRMGQLEVAEAEYLEAIRLEPRFAEAYYGLGLLSEQRQHPVDALKAYNKAVEIKPDFALAQARIAKLSRAQNSLGDR